MSLIGWRGTLALVAVLAVQAGCGGAGGGGGGGCPPGSVLTVSPTSLRVTAGDPAVEFGAGVTGCTEEIRWHLAGPGSLDRTAGVPVRYTPPASVAALAVPTNHFTVPADVSLPPAAAYTWRIRGSSAFTTVEDAAGPGGFLAGAPFPYRIAQSDPWPFTTAP